MKKSTRVKLEQAYDVVSEMHEAGTVSDDNYMKVLVSLAHDWGKTGDLQEALILLRMVDEEYVRNALPKQMKGDSIFAAAALALAELLEKAGIATDEPPDADFLQLSMAKPAQA